MVNFDVDREAEKLAIKLVEQNISSAQFKRFYNDFKSLQRKYEIKYNHNNGKKEAFDFILPYIKLTKSKVAYAKARKLISDDFKKWLTESVDAINNYESFELFLLHFEAVLGFAYGHGLSDNKYGENQ